MSIAQSPKPRTPSATPSIQRFAGTKTDKLLANFLLPANIPLFSPVTGFSSLHCSPAMDSNARFLRDAQLGPRSSAPSQLPFPEHRPRLMAIVASSVKPFVIPAATAFLAWPGAAGWACDWGPPLTKPSFYGETKRGGAVSPSPVLSGTAVTSPCSCSSALARHRQRRQSGRPSLSPCP